MGLFSSTSDLLQRQDVKGQLQLLEVLHSKASSTANLAKLLHKHPGCLSAVVQLLSSSHAGVKQNAALVLGRFAYAGTPANRDSIAAEPGAIRGLTALLNSNEADGQDAAAAALGALSNWCPANRERIGQEPGVIPRLVALLSGQTGVELQRLAAGVLTNLAWRCPANRQQVRSEPDAFKHLAAMLSSRDASVQRTAAWTLASLALGSPEDSQCISQEPDAIPRLVALLSSSNTDVRFGGALAIVAAAEGSGDVRQALERVAAVVWPALCNMQQFTEQPLIFCAEVSRLLHNLAAGSTALCTSMAGSNKITLLLQAFGQRLQGTADNTATAALNLLLNSRMISGVPDTPTPAAAAPSSSAHDAAVVRDQAMKPPIRPSAKLATTVELLGALESVSKMVPILGAPLQGFIKPLTKFLDTVEQVRVNKAKALSMKKRVEALLEFLACMFSAKELWQSALARDGRQLAVLQQQLKRLGDALMKAAGLVSKWSKPMLLDMAVRFLKAGLDKDDIKDFENTVNKAVQDLNSVLAGLNLIHTLQMQQQVQLLVLEARASDVGLDQKLEQANQQDMQQLQGHLEQLLGGQQELQQQLAAATQEQRQEWASVAGHLGQLAGDVGVIKDEVCCMQGVMKELAAAVRAVEEGIKQQGASTSADARASSSGGGGGTLVRSQLMLDRERVQWDANDILDRGGFASVYRGTFDGHDVAIKLLDMAAFAGALQDKMFEEAAVLSRLRHPCIVTFWGVVVVEDSKAKPAAARSSFPKSRHDSAGSYGSRGRVAIRSSSSGSSSSSRSQLSLGLVLECCDESLESVLRKEPLLPLPEALHVAERIACGLKYLHTDAPLRVVHGDLKPANVLLTERFDTLSVQLTDFGLSSTVAVHTMSMGAKNLVARNAGGQPGATLAWAAPELLEAWAQGHSAPSTFAADVYAFGLILHQLLMGCWPYEGMLLAEDALKAAIRGGRRPGWVGWEEVRGKEAEPDVLSRLKALVEACWAQEATKRPTAQKVHTQLVELKREVVVG